MKVSISELALIRDQIKRKEVELKDCLPKLLKAKKTLNKTLGVFSPSQSNRIIDFDTDILSDIKKESYSISKNFNWKKVSYEILRELTSL